MRGLLRLGELERERERLDEGEVGRASASAALLVPRSQRLLAIPEAALLSVEHNESRLQR